MEKDCLILVGTASAIKSMNACMQLARAYMHSNHAIYDHTKSVQLRLYYPSDEQLETNDACKTINIEETGQSYQIGSIGKY